MNDEQTSIHAGNANCESDNNSRKRKYKHLVRVLAVAMTCRLPKVLMNKRNAVNRLRKGLRKTLIQAKY